MTGKRRSVEEYGRMSEKAERGGFRVVPGSAQGPAVRRGRPTAGEVREELVTRTVKMPTSMDREITVKIEATGGDRSRLIRDAVAEYLERH